MPAASPLTQAEIRAIVNHENLVIRNLQITQGYYRLSQGMRKVVSHKNASWTAFATHASKTAGQALRHELMPRLLKSAMLRLAGYDNTFYYLNEALEAPDQNQTLTLAQSNLLARALKRVSELISEGNVTVFDELAWPFASMIATFARDWKYDEGKWEDFLQAHFIPGPLESGGQDYLVEAFTAYYQAWFETDSKRKAEFILLGNLLIGLHEQTRLQPQIEQALAVPLEVLLGAGEQDNLKDGVRQPRAGKVGLSRKIVTQAATQMWMSITLPSRELKLGENVVAPTGVNRFPADLITIENPRCLELVRRFETRQDTLTGSAADNWMSLDDRMSFVVDFFRSHQQYRRMFEAPFLESQAQTIEAGNLPGGPL